MGMRKKAYTQELPNMQQPPILLKMFSCLIRCLIFHLKIHSRIGEIGNIL